MSDTKSSPANAGKKSQTKSESKSETKSEAKSDSKPAEASASTGSDGGGKSARESVGGAAVGHYGFFSNIKSPEYKSGWDDIWGKKKSGGAKPAASRKKTAPRSPVVVSLDFEDLPADIREGLAAAVRAELKKKRVSYDARAKKGEVDWTIDCEVRR